MSCFAEDLLNAISNGIVMKIRDSEDTLGGVYGMKRQDLEFRLVTKMDSCEETSRQYQCGHIFDPLHAFRVLQRDLGADWI